MCNAINTNSQVLNACHTFQIYSWRFLKKIFCFYSHVRKKEKKFVLILKFVYCTPFVQSGYRTIKLAFSLKPNKYEVSLNNASLDDMYCWIQDLGFMCLLRLTY